MVGFVASFVQETYSLTADFLGRMGKEKSPPVAKKDSFGGLVAPLMEFVSPQHTWLCVLHEEASQNEKHRLSLAT